MESNNNNGVYKPSDLIFVKSVDVNKNELISYENIDGGDSLRFDLGNRDRIKYFILSVYDQNGNTIQDMVDYFMHIQFIIRKKEETSTLLNKVIEYNRDNYIVLGYIFDLLNKIFNNIFSKL